MQGVRERRPSRAGPGKELEQLPRPQRSYSTAGDDYVLQDAEAEQRAGLDETLGGREVLPAGLGVARGVVVNKHGG